MEKMLQRQDFIKEALNNLKISPQIPFVARELMFDQYLPLIILGKLQNIM